MSRFPVNPEDNWIGKWRAILEKEDGTIDLDQLKLELADFEDMIQRLTSLTCYMTRHRLSYATYPVATIVQLHEDILEEEREEQRKEDLKDGYCHFCASELTDDHYDEAENND